jgi:hypothetical protein
MLTVKNDSFEGNYLLSSRGTDRPVTIPETNLFSKTAAEWANESITFKSVT